MYTAVQFVFFPPFLFPPYTHSYVDEQTDSNPFQRCSASLSTSASSVPPFVKPAQQFPFIQRAHMEQCEAREGKENEKKGGKESEEKVSAQVGCLWTSTILLQVDTDSLYLLAYRCRC